MSLILEALKKSEAERRLGETPSLNTVPAWKSPSRPSRARWLLPALAIALAAGWSNRDLFGDSRAADDESNTPMSAAKVASTPAPPALANEKTSLPTPQDVVAPKPAPLIAAPPTPAIAAHAAAGLPMPEPTPLPQSMADLDAMKGVSPEDQRRIRSGELYVPNPAVLAARDPTSETPIVTAESALPALIPELGAATPEVGKLPAREPAKTETTDALLLPTPPAAPALVADTAATQAPAASAPVIAVPAPMAEAAADAPITIYDLTLEQRQGLPPLKMSMHVYHRDVTRRFVIIDGKRLNEDGVITNDTWARQIVPEGVIIEYKNTRFLLPRLGG